MTLQQQEQERKKKTTKKYDAVAKKIRKLLSASAQTFIPELCEALKEDWFAEYTHEHLKQVKEARDNIRDKVFEDWSYEHGGRYSDDNIWSDRTIRINFPDWLRDPILQVNKVEALRMANEAKMHKKTCITEREKQKLEDIATKLPDSVILPKPKEPSYEGDDLDLEGGQRFTALGEKGKTASYMKGNITYHSARLFEALTEIDHLPYKDEDLTVEYIKPTRDYRKNLILELDEQSRKTVWNSLGSVEAAIQDMLDLLEEEMKKDDKDQ
jgi:hypothetical protein